MSENAWLTPNSAPGAIRAKLLYVPMGEEWEQAVRGALIPLIDPAQWQQYGTQTPDQASAAFEDPLYLTLQWRDARMIGEIIPYAGIDSPDFWLDCDGASVSETTYAALFAVIGYTFGNPGGGDFRLPDLRGRTILGTGTGAGLTPRSLGDQVGAETHQLTTSELPAHYHTVHDHSVPAVTGELAIPVSTPGVSGGVTGSTGEDAAHNNMQPSLAIRYLIYAGV